MAYLYHSIQPIKIFIYKSILFQDPNQNGMESGKIIGIFSYKNTVPSFKILLDNGAVWDFCVPSYVRYNNDNHFTEKDFQLIDLAYQNCPSCNFAVYTEPELSKYPIDVYFKQSKCWSYSAQYLLTLDWWTANESFNLVKLTNGQLAFVPNHKMMCRLNKQVPLELPKYRAFKNEGKL